MLTADQIDVLPGPIVELFERFHLSVIRDIARRLAGLNYASAAWQVQRLIEAGKLYEDILAELAQISGKSETVLQRIFQEAGVTALRFDDMIYRQAGLEPLPLNLSPAITEALVVGLQRTAGAMRNLTATTAISGQEAFINAADLAYMQISTGAFDYNTAIREAVKQVASDGLQVIHFSGHRDKLDVAIRRTVLTGVNQTVGEMTERRADEMEVDLVQTSAHVGARNKGDVPENHEMWQGRTFTRGKDPKNAGYPNFYDVTGYGTGVGLAGFNCRHSHYPFFKGISVEAYSRVDLDHFSARMVTYNDKEMTYYDATQEQRRIEREIRKAKREAAALEAAGRDNTTEQAHIKALQARMRDFLDQTGLQRQRVREQIYE
jgi:AraC-like DNA-binding protein